MIQNLKTRYEVRLLVHEFASYFLNLTMLGVVHLVLVLFRYARFRLFDPMDLLWGLPCMGLGFLIDCLFWPYVPEPKRAKLNATEEKSERTSKFQM